MVNATIITQLVQHKLMLDAKGKVVCINTRTSVLARTIVKKKGNLQK